MLFMSKLAQTIRDIKSVKIQGAGNVAKSSVEAIREHFSGKKFKSSEAFFKAFNSASAKLGKTRPTEPLMRNSFRFVRRELGSSEDPRELLNRLFSACRQAQYHYQIAEESMFEMGAGKIENGMKIFTHCHSSTVMGVLKKAKEHRKHFEVYNTETRPLFQGRITAAEMAKAGIPVKHFVDSGAKIALKQCDLMMIGADAITAGGRVVNKIGSEMFAMIAERYDVPLYVFADSWKFDPLTLSGDEVAIEIRPPKEIWNRPKKGVEIRNIAFEEIDPKLIRSIISELGETRPEQFVQTLRETYPWILR